VLTSHYPPIPNALSPGYTIEQYQPERIKYGGLAGVKIAERLFEVSSEIALRAIDLESETGLNLLLLAAALMELMVSKTHPESKHRERFLKRYLWYWSGQNRPGADALRFDLEQEITGRPGDVSTGIAEWPGNPAVRRLIEDYSEGVDRTLHSLNAIKHITGQGPQVSFDYIHMNNNRFGVLPIEEAYLAALLLAAGESTPSTQIVNRNTTYASPVTRS
jgi:thiopeptide-type bacteriocin biosynthesis protein